MIELFQAARRAARAIGWAAALSDVLALTWLVAAVWALGALAYALGAF